MDLTNPVPALEGLLALFEDGAAKGGTFVNQVACQAAVDGIADAIIAIGALGARLEAAGLLEPVAERRPGPRTPDERRQLARLAAQVDHEGRVLRLPTALTRETVR